MVAILGPALEFPSPETANRDGLVAVGGDLSIERLLLAYQNGIFPWPIFDDELMTWFSPDPRAVLELSDLHVSRSLKKVLRRGEFEVSINRACDEVIARCAAPGQGRESTWITEALRKAYGELHRAGHVHSVEVWQEQRLVGGLYGVSMGGLFAGESMFAAVSNASKVALVALVQHLGSRGHVLLDIQQATGHMVSMGGTEIPRREYLRRLDAALRLPCTFV